MTLKRWMRRNEVSTWSGSDGVILLSLCERLGEGPDEVENSDGVVPSCGFAAAQCGKPPAYRQLPLHVCGSAAVPRRSRE